jgi:peptidoglycan/xylan/chitin deacetylase (PgdA/CDA1 family)
MMPVLGSGSPDKLVAGLGYHDVTDHPAESGFQRDGALPFKLSPETFRAHLDQIAARGMTPGLVSRIDFSRPGRHLMLTFDDGGKSALEIGEELCRRGWRGHFFISTALVGRKTFLTALEIRELRRAGHVIGSHSHSHPDIYRELPWEQMVIEWRQSADILAQILGEPCTAAAIPGGEISNAVIRSAAVAGIRHLFTSEPWLQPRIVAGTLVLGRFCAKNSTTAEEIGRLAAFQGWRSKLIIRQLKQLAGRGFPTLYRIYVGRSTREWQRSGV